MTTQQKIEYINPDDTNNIFLKVINKINEVIKVINQLAPALPEDEECEVVEVVSIPVAYIEDLILTKLDGKKLKIKVVSPK